MEIPKWLDKLLDVGDDAEVSTASRIKQSAEADPVTNTEQIPKKAKKKKKKIKSILKTMPISTWVVVAVVALILILSALTMPKSGASSSEQKTVYEYPMSSDITLGNLKFSIDDYFFSEHFLGDSKSKVTGAAGNVFVAVEVSVQNMGTTDRTLTPKDKKDTAHKYSYSLIYSNGYEYFPTVPSGNKNLLNNYTSKIIPLQTVTRYVCFEVPEVIADSAEPLAFRIYFNSYTVTWFLRGAPQAS